MKFFLIYIILLCFVQQNYCESRVRKFKDAFTFGVTTHNALNSSDQLNINQEYVKKLKDLNVDFHIFTLSWSKLFKNPTTLELNEDILAEYLEYMKLLSKKDIEPIVVLSDENIPQDLAKIGGWYNDEVIDYFLGYAKLMFEKLGNEVEAWITFNDPFKICKGFQDGDYSCAKNILIAHSKLFRFYKDKWMTQQRGAIGIGINIDWNENMNQTENDDDSAEILRQYEYGIFLNPLLGKNGDYPEVVKNNVERRSKDGHQSGIRLPTLSSDDIKLIKLSLDFLGVVHYTTKIVTKSESSTVNLFPSFTNDVRVNIDYRSEWRQSKAVSTLYSVPYGFYRSLVWINQNYDYPLLVISENGWADVDDTLEDNERVDYVTHYLNALLIAIEDGTNVFGYSYRSFFDESSDGASVHYGLYRNSSNILEMKQSGKLYRRIIRRRTVEVQTTQQHKDEL